MRTREEITVAAEESIKKSDNFSEAATRLADLILEVSLDIRDLLNNTRSKAQSIESATEAGEY